MIKLVGLVACTLLVSTFAIGSERPPEVPKQRVYWTTDLQRAAWQGDVPEVKALLERAAHEPETAAGILAETPTGLNALHMAVVSDQIPVIVALLRSPFYKRFLENLELNLTPEAHGYKLEKKRARNGKGPRWPSKAAWETILQNVPEYAKQLKALYPGDSRLQKTYRVELEFLKASCVFNTFVDLEVLGAMFKNLRQCEGRNFAGALDLLKEAQKKGWCRDDSQLPKIQKMLEELLCRK